MYSFRRLDIGLDSKLIMDYYSAPAMLSDYLSSINRDGPFLQKHSPESLGKKMMSISSCLENESLYHLLKDFFDSFFHTHSYVYRVFY